MRALTYGFIAGGLTATVIFVGYVAVTLVVDFIDTIAGAPL